MTTVLRAQVAGAHHEPSAAMAGLVVGLVVVAVVLVGVLWRLKLGGRLNLTALWRATSWRHGSRRPAFGMSPATRVERADWLALTAQMPARPPAAAAVVPPVAVVGPDSGTPEPPVAPERFTPPPVLGPVRDATFFKALLAKNCFIDSSSGGAYFAGTTPMGEVRGFVMRGRKHANRGTVGQDAAAARWTEGRLVVAVADGVSNSRRAAEAARSAVAAVANLPEALLSASAQRLLAGVFTRASVGLAGETTLSVAVVDQGPVGARVTLGLVGDSPVWLLDKWGFHLLDVDETPDGEVHFVAPRVPPKISCCDLLTGDCLLVMSDGLGGPLAGPFKDDVQGFFAENWRTPPEALVFCQHVDFRLEAQHDDRSVVGVWVA